MAIATQKLKSSIKDGDLCLVVDGVHKGKSGTARDLNVSKTGHLTITVIQENGERFKTLAKNVVGQSMSPNSSFESRRSASAAQLRR